MAERPFPDPGKFVTGGIIPTVDDCAIAIPESCGIVIFGASGDLTQRKIIPSLYRLFLEGLLPEGFFVMEPRGRKCPMRASGGRCEGR